MSDGSCLPMKRTLSASSSNGSTSAGSGDSGGGGVGSKDICKDDTELQPVTANPDADDDDDDDGADDGADADADADDEFDDDEMVRESISIELLWKGSERYQMRIPKYATVLSIKVLIEELTEIEADSQKLLGLVKGRLPSDGDTLVGLGVRNGTRVRLMGTRMADRLKFDAKNAWGEPEDTGVTGISSGADPVDRASGSLRRGHGRSRVVSDDWKHSLAKIVSDASLRVLNAPRPGKKLAVLDLDYTLFDCKNITGNVADMARPGLHEFLAAIYPHYDLIVWSQTRWHVLESKITLLGMLTHPLYRITTALDISTMFTVKSIRNGELGTHQVKPLEFIWSRFPQHYSSQNTIHIDDLSRNFALNYQNGLKIRPFKRADTQPRSDTELFRLARYLLKIARLESLDELDHSSWHSYK
ncbi:hypothetical protein GGF37_004980 [Kickxella alabastrina]|nr:hypothetical protein GGF37_004980 [Kickxella alabastrina]